MGEVCCDACLGVCLCVNYLSIFSAKMQPVSSRLDANCFIFVVMEKGIVFNEDCMAVMSRYPDKYFDLAVVDPPYGIGVNMNMGRRQGMGKKTHDQNLGRQRS